MSKLRNRLLRNTKRILHEDYIDHLSNRGIPRSLIYSSISSELGYTFHCGDLSTHSDFDYIISVVKAVCHTLEEDFKTR